MTLLDAKSQKMEFLALSNFHTMLSWHQYVENGRQNLANWKEGWAEVTDLFYYSW